MKRGFTLIELLVVVLIIGILSSVALPQYKKAVLKARFSTYLPLMRSIKDAQEVYYMANGEYAHSLLDLDVQMSGQCRMYQYHQNMWYCGENFYIDNVSAFGKSIGYLSAAFCTNRTEENYITCRDSTLATIVFYYNHYSNDPSLAGHISCVGATQEGRDLCKTFQGSF